MLRLKVTPVVGLPQFTGWSQVAESAVSVSVRLVVVFAISGKHAGNVGRDISAKISDFYFYDAEQLHEFLTELVSFAHAEDCKIFFSCAVLGRDKSIFATYGGSVFLKRAEKSGKILSSDYEVKIVEGNYEDEDVFVLTTLQADQFLNEIQLKFQQGYDPDIIITSIVPGLHAQEDSSLSALVFISKDDEKALDLDELNNEETPFLEIDQEKEVIVKDETNQNVEENFEALAKIDLEVDPIPMPGVLNKIGNKIKPKLIWMLIKLKKITLYLWKLIKQIVVKIWSFIKKLFIQIKINGLKSVITNPTMYVSEMKSKKGTWKVIAGVILIVGVLIIFGVFNYQKGQETKRIQDLLNPIQTEFSIAKELVDSDPISAREKISSAIAQVENLEKENKNSSAFVLLSEAKHEYTTYLESISGIEELQELPVFYDLRLAKSDFISSGIDISDQTLVLFDADMKQLLMLDYSTKRVSMRDFSSRDLLKSVVVNGPTVYVLVDGIYKFELNLNSEAELNIVRELGDSNRNATFIDAYDRFVYAINPEKRNIYRYAQTEDGYSEPIGWMKSATGIDYESLRSIAIDGDVWLSTSDGQVKKFTAGFEEIFELRGLQAPFEKDIYLYTNENLENLYVLDPSNNRVVILSKAGDFIKEVKSVSLASANSLAVSESLAKIFIGSGSIIYQIDL
jgi:hypothetical protein